MILSRIFTNVLIICALFTACDTAKRKAVPKLDLMYDIANPDIRQLPAGLDEISGIIYYPKDTSVFAIVDEDGLLFKIPLNKKDSIRQWRFDKKHDFEDVVLLDSIFYVLISNGDIESIQFSKQDSLVTHTSQFPNASKKLNEFESLYYDDSLKQLILYCKKCEEDNKKTVSAWGYDISNGQYTQSVYNIDVKPIDKQLGGEKIKFKPSATAVNPVTNDLYVLASVDHLLVVTDRQGKFKELYELDPAIYKQPEGMAFTPTGDLIITNEWHNEGAATILFIRNNKK